MNTVDRFFDWVSANTAIFHAIMAIFMLIGVIGLIHDLFGERILLWAERHGIVTIDRTDLDLCEEER